jgi:LmbE family N-acetylglucosaminyl deacetylase
LKKIEIADKIVYMKKIEFREGDDAIVIVAHPDDETIWMGGLIADNPEVSWTIFSLCRSSDHDRAPKFLKVCGFFKAKGIIRDLEDEGKMSIKESVPLIEDMVRQELRGKSFDFIFTHGPNGEYGHHRHKGVHRAVKNLFDKKELEANFLLFFNYRKISRVKYSKLREAPSTDILFRLSPELYGKKIEAMSDIYGFDPKGIDASYCTNPEAFRVYRK